MKEFTTQKRFDKLVNKVAGRRKISKVLADPAYDSKADFNLLTRLGIEPGIKIRKGDFRIMRYSRMTERLVKLVSYTPHIDTNIAYNVTEEIR
jgi:mRNA-degrading endonuclease RelE of RelBE toxin-antitoxin system